MACPFALTKDGIETQIGTNHVGHFVFTTTLLPALQKQTPSRVVNVSSYGHTFTPKEGINFDRINDETFLSAWARYGQSKLANILFSRGLDTRFGDSGIYVNSLHPGVVHTELMRGPKDLYSMSSGILSVFGYITDTLSYLTSLTAKQGALTQIYLATSPDVVEKGIRGKYFVPFATEATTSAQANDDALADKLWEWSEKMVAEKLGKA